MHKGASLGCRAKEELGALPLNRALPQRAAAPCGAAPHRGTGHLRGLQYRRRWLRRGHPGGSVAATAGLGDGALGPAGCMAPAVQTAAGGMVRRIR